MNRKTPCGRTIDFTVAPATSGEAIRSIRLDREFKPGVNTSARGNAA